MAEGFCQLVQRAIKYNYNSIRLPNEVALKHNGHDFL